MIHPSPRNATKLFVFNQEKSDMRMIYYPSLRGTTNVAIVANESNEMVFHICKPFETRSILWKYWPQVSKLLQKYEKFGYVADIDATIGDIEERSIQTEWSDTSTKASLLTIQETNVESPEKRFCQKSKKKKSKSQVGKINTHITLMTNMHWKVLHGRLI